MIRSRCPRPPFRRCAGTASALVLLLLTLRASAAEPTFGGDVRPWLSTHCVKCHGPKVQKGGLDLAAFIDEKSITRRRKLWRKVVAQLESQEMPPAGEPEPPAEERTRMVGWIQGAIDRYDPADLDPGPGPARRLSLAEYNRTVGDLLGIDFDASEAVGLPDDCGEGNRFGNLGAALNLPPALLDKYFAAADKALDRLFGTELADVDGEIKQRAKRSLLALTAPVPAADLPSREAARRVIARFARRAYRRPLRDGEVDRLLVLYDRAIARKLPHEDGLRLMFKAALVSPYFLFRIERDRAPEGSAEAYRVDDHELAVRLSYFLWSSMPDDLLMDLADRGRLTAPGPSSEPTKLGGLVLGTGSDPNDQGRHAPEKAFDGDPGSFYDNPASPDGNWVGLDLRTPRPIKAIAFAPRPGQEQRMVGGVFQASASADFSGEVIALLSLTERPDAGSVRVAVEAPGAYRYVRYLAPGNSHGNIAELEVWGVADGTVLDQQVARMLDDPRARALTDRFAVPWLQVGKVFSARPSTEFFPTFSAELRKAMFEETATFFDAIRREDRSVLELLDADSTFLNEELARHYGIPDVKGKELRRVALKPDQHRGGLLGMGSILALTSHTSRTSPTMRGKWVLEVVFGDPPPPPPANVSMIKEEKDRKGPPKSFREQLAQHAADGSCVSCHKRMDPLGFALDNFDAVGSWRADAGGQPLDTSGVLPSGEEFRGVTELKPILLKRRGEFVRNLSEQMLTYALGRSLDYHDDGPVRELATALERGDHRLSALVGAVARSYPFLHRRNADVGAENPTSNGH